MTNKFVVVGGGAAGWLTALITQKHFPDTPIVLVESQDIGVLGAGEGTTPVFVDMMRQIDISIPELIKNTSSTIKQGVLFDNWDSGEGAFFHGFVAYKDELGSKALNHMSKNFSWGEASLINYYLAYKNINLEKADLHAMASFSNKVLFTKAKIASSPDSLIENFESHGKFALHFDARAMAKYLSSVAQSRGIHRIEGKVEEVNLNSFGDVESITLKGGESVSGNFFFDCTGFARLIAVKKLGSRWHSFKESLPTNRAMPFFLGIDKKQIPTYSLARAMEKGWLWKAPLQHRYGCGYVYDSSQISDDDAKKEVDAFAGFEVEIPKMFSFEPGFVENPWNRNCLAVGLSSGFVEPLEATSFYQNLNTLRKFFINKDLIFSIDEKGKKLFNEGVAENQHGLAAFIYLHYTTNKTSNSFWKNFSSDYKMPKGLEETMDQLQSGVLLNSKISPPWLVDSIFKVAYNHNILKLSNLKKIYEDTIVGAKVDEEIKKQFIERSNLVDTMIDHSSFLIEMGADLESK